MDIILYDNQSEKNKLDKLLITPNTITGTLKQECSISSPVILIEIENPVGYNYAYIPEFSRYYYISDMVSVRNNLWRIYLTVDVLMSFKDYIVNIPVILSDTEETGKEFYLSGNVWKSKVKELTDIINFPSGLNANGEFILITAGG